MFSGKRNVTASEITVRKGRGFFYLFFTVAAVISDVSGHLGNGKTEDMDQNSKL